MNANGGLTFGGSTAVTKEIDMSGGAAVLNLKGGLTVPASSATLTAGTAGSIFNYADNAAQTIYFFPAGKYYNLNINNTHASGATLNADITSSNTAGNLTVGDINSASLFNTGNFAITLSNSRTATIAAGSTLNCGTSTISFGTGSPNLTINGTFKTANINGFSGAANTSVNSTNSPTFSLGANSTIEYNSNSNQVVSARSDYANLLVSGGATKTANGSISTASSLTVGSATTFNASSYIHYVAGTLVSSGTFVPNTSTMNFSGSSAQTIPAVSYNKLTTSNSGTKTAGGALTILSDFTIGSGTTFNGGSYSHSIGGDFTNSGTFTAAGSTFNFNGSVNQSATGSLSFNNVAVSNGNQLIIGNSISIDGSLLLSNGKININNNTLTLNGNFTGDATNSIKGSSGSSLTLGSGYTNTGTDLYFDKSSNNNYIKNFTVNTTVSLGNQLNISDGATPGTLTLASGVTLNTNDSLVLKSTASGTSRIAALPVDGSGNATAFINGKVTIERYFATAKGWHLLSAPVSSSNIPTINEAWQEGLTTASSNPNLYPGYGVKICGGTTANGYDASTTNSTFIKVYNNSLNAFTALPTGTNVPINTYPGYFLYIRGDRSVDMMQGISAAITATTLRVKGEVNTGKQTVTINAANYTVLANPYPSAIDFHSVIKNNVSNVMYVWDPKLAGVFGVGGFVTLCWNNSTHVYDRTSCVTNISQYIPSGEAVLIRTVDGINPGSIIVNETDKVTNGFCRYNSMGIDRKLRVNMYLVNNDSTTSLLDGVLTTYSDENDNRVNAYDAKKITGSNQSLGIKREGTLLAIERRKTITSSDTCFLNLAQMRTQNYQLEIITENIEQGYIAFLKDNYSPSRSVIPIRLNAVTNLPFFVNANPGSFAPGRFSIIIQHATALPGTLESEKNSQLITSHKGVSNNNGAVAKTTEQLFTNTPGMVVYPNPVKGKSFNLLLNNISKGAYQLYLYNSLGQLVSEKMVNIQSGQTIAGMELPMQIPAGKYELILDNKLLVKRHNNDFKISTTLIRK